MLLPSSRDCQDLITSSASSLAYIVLCLGNIATALSTSATSCTLTTSGKTAQDVIEMRRMLIQLGYRLTQSTTTITIKWDNSFGSQLNA
jgi:hypothetical protein